MWSPTLLTMHSKFLSFVLLAGTLLAGSASLNAQTSLIEQGSTWKYLDDGSNQGTTWREVGFDDSVWAQGPAQLGYGDGDEATVLSYGSNSSAKYITTYFRKSFTVANPGAISALTLDLLRDDGAVIYLNGTEVARSNMPTGTISYTTLSPTAVSGAAETSTFYSYTVSPSLLTAGTNVLAVEIHQQAGTSSDISFDLRLISGAAASLVRDPYLQSISTNQAVICWRTLTASDSVVQYGLSPSSLSSTASTTGNVTDHAVTLTGLSPNTRYYYAIGDGTTTLAQGADYYVTTHPLTGTAKNTRIWVLGDSGTANANAAAVRNSFYSWNGGAHTDFLLMLGDNAYNSGTDAEYTTAVFGMYPTTLRNTPLWPTLGNHDATSSDSPTQSGPYYSSFYLPTNGVCGGFASGTEAYYSFDYANMHFICLDSQDTDRSVGGPMYVWLQNDLAATTQEWIIAFWHHPPYTKGTHDSDSLSDSSGRMVEMRERFLPLLEDYGVDLVLAGHSHAYERSFLIDGHYGYSTTFNAATMVKDAGSGGPTYVKEAIPHDGTVYVVAGSSGQAGTGPLNHPAMYVSLSSLGSMALDVNGNQLLAKFIDGNGTVVDQFGLRHEEAPTAPSGLTATAGDGSVSLDWADNAESDLAGYQVFRSQTSGSGYTLLGSTTASNYNDSAATNGTTYYYVVAAYDSYGFVSSNSNQASAQPHDLSAPAAPTGLTAAAGDSSISLDWAENQEADLAGYLVYRSTTSATGYDLLGSSATTTYTDNSAVNGTTYYYVVQAVDTESNTSGNSAEASATPSDMTPPGIPSGLTASAADATISLNWADNTESDLADYRVYRSTSSGGAYTLVASTAASSYTDNSVTNGTTYYYVVQAVDAAGNSSAPSAETSATPESVLPPIWVNNIVMKLTKSGAKYKPQATVTVRKAGNVAASNAQVTGEWLLNGTPIATVTGNSNKQGSVTLSAPTSKPASGSVFTFTVTDITANELSYQSSLNIETTDSITVP